MSGIMNNYFYGKAGKADYTPENLPSNRVALFFEMLRLRLTSMVGMNLVCILTALPIILWTYMNIQVLLIELGISETGAIAAEVAADATNIIRGRLTAYFVFLIPCLMFYQVFHTGVMYILRNWARDQHTFTFSDFKDALKENWKGGLLLGFLNGVSLLLAYIGYVYYGQMSLTSGAFWAVPQTLVIIFTALWWMANMLITPMMVTYNMKFTTLLRNSFIMIFARLPMSLLIWGVSVAIPVCAVLLPIPYILPITGILYILIGLALVYFVYVSYANSCFDRYLNPRIEGAQVNMGLRDRSFDEEDDIEVTEEDIKNL